MEDKIKEPTYLCILIHSADCINKNNDSANCNYGIESNSIQDKKNVFLSKTRRMYKEDKLPKYKVDLLLDAGFNFKGRKVDMSLTFEKRVEIAADFIKLNGVGSIKYNTVHEGVTIGNWLASCKALMRDDKSVEDKVKLLVDNNIITQEELSSKFKKVTKEEMWLNSLQRYSDIMEKESKTKEESKWCCNWRSKQLKSYRNGTLSKERELVLSSVVALTK